MLRWLVPFTWGIDARAIEILIRLAEKSGARLIPVSFIKPHHQAEKARLEQIEQSNDFLELFANKARRHHIAIERYEVFTYDVVQSITQLMTNLHCEQLLLVIHGRRAVLLNAQECLDLLLNNALALLIIEIPDVQSPAQHIIQQIKGYLGKQREGNGGPFSSSDEILTQKTVQLIAEIRSQQ